MDLNEIGVYTLWGFLAMEAAVPAELPETGHEVSVCEELFTTSDMKESKDMSVI